MCFETLAKLANKNADAFHHAPVTIGFLGDSVTNGCFEVLPALTDHGEEGTAFISQDVVKNAARNKCGCRAENAYRICFCIREDGGRAS